MKQVSIKLNFTLEEDVANVINGLPKGKRSKWVNMILKKYLEYKKNNELGEGFKRKIDDFESWEELGFETWN